MKNGIDFKTGAVTKPNAIPQGAVAVAYNLTVANTSGPGWAALVPAGDPSVSTSSINWTAANAVVANSGGSASTALSAHVIVDITGYYISES